MAYVDEQNNSQPLQGTTTGSEDNQNNEQGGKTMNTNDSIIAKVTTDVNSIDVGLRLVSELGTRVTGEIKPSSTARVGLNYIDSGDLEYVGGFAFATDQPVHESAYVLVNESLGQSYVVYVFDEHEQVAENNQARAAALKQWQNEAIALGIRHGEEVESLRSKESSIPVPGCNGWEVAKVGYPTSRGELLSGKRMKQSKPKRVPNEQIEETEIMNVSEPTPEDVRQLEQQFTKELVDKVAVVELESKSPEEIHERRMEAVKKLQQSPKMSQNAFLLQVLREYYEFSLRRNKLTGEDCDWSTPITADDIANLTTDLQGHFTMLTLTPELVRARIHQLSAKASFHPVKDLIEALPYTLPINEALVEFLNVLMIEPTELAVAQMRCAAIGFVSRVDDPGSQVDNMPIIVSPEGGGKSKVARNMGFGYACDMNKQHQERDFLATMHRSQLVVVNECEKLWKWLGSSENVKDFISRREDSFRISGAHGTPETRARGFIFIGTTNAVGGRFIQDDGECRRFHVFESISSEENPIDEDAADAAWRVVVAAANREWKNGAKPILPTHLIPVQRAYVKKFTILTYKASDRQNTIKSLLEDFVNQIDTEETRIQTADMMTYLRGVMDVRVQEKEIAAAMREIGYKQSYAKTGQGKNRKSVRCWVPE